jgi:NADH-quinone oxidoreductase subunit H
VAIGDLVLAQQQLSHVTVVVLGALAFTTKVIVLCLVQLSIRWTLPRFRYDQLMRLCWRVLLPASLVNVLATGLILLVIDAAGPSAFAGLKVAGSVTMALVAVGVFAAGIALVLYWLQPVERRRVPETTTSKIVAALGATPRKMQLGA